MPRIEKGQQIVRKDPVPEEVRTDERDAAADVIERMWPADFEEIAEESGHSRQHIRNTLDQYFDPVEPDLSEEAVVGGASIRIPTGVNKEDYLRGVLRGLQLAQETE